MRRTVEKGAPGRCCLGASLLHLACTTRASTTHSSALPHSPALPLVCVPGAAPACERAAPSAPAPRPDASRTRACVPHSPPCPLQRTTVSSHLSSSTARISEFRLATCKRLPAEPARRAATHTMAQATFRAAAAQASGRIALTTTQAATHAGRTSNKVWKDDLSLAPAETHDRPGATEVASLLWLARSASGAVGRGGPAQVRVDVGRAGRGGARVRGARRGGGGRVKRRALQQQLQGAWLCANGLAVHSGRAPRVPASARVAPRARAAGICSAAQEQRSACRIGRGTSWFQRLPVVGSGSSKLLARARSGRPRFALSVSALPLGAARRAR